MVPIPSKPVAGRTAGFAIAAIALFSVAAGAKAAEVQLSVSSHETFVGLPIVAQIAVDNAKDATPPKFPEIDGVDVKLAGAPVRSSQVFSFNGRVTRTESVGYRFILTPKREGKFTIPAIDIQVDGQRFTTEPTEFVATKSETGDLMFVEVVGARKEAFVGEPMKLTLKIWIKPLRDATHGVILDAQETWNLLAEDQTTWGVFDSERAELAAGRNKVRAREVLRPDASGVERSYYLYEIDHVIYPQKAGELETGDVRIVIAYPAGIRGRGIFGTQFTGVRPVIADAKVEPITVKPVPTEGMPADYRGAIGCYEIETQAVPTKVKVGDQITLRIQVTGGERLDLLQAPPLAQLPQLTRDFKVTEEPLAGVVHGDTKSFIATLQPLRSDLREIPAIPFSSFDPETEEFVTVNSAPIPIEVSPADELALSNIISATNGSSGGTAKRNVPAEAINPLMWQFRGASVLSTSRPPSDAVLLIALAFPPAAFFSLVMLRQSRGWLRDSSLWRQRQARRLAARRLDHADGSEDVAQAALGYVADRFGLNGASLTRRELVCELQHRGVSSEAIRQWDELLTQCENAKYAGGTVGTPQELARLARNCIAGIDRYCSIRGETSCLA